MSILDLFKPYNSQKDVRYVPGGDARQKLDVYTPKTGVTAATRVIVFFHGGAFRIGNKADYEYVADSFVRKGFIVVTPNYRLWDSNAPTINRWPTQVSDAADAVRWVLANIKVGANPRKCFIMGHSAGGILVNHLILDPTWLAGSPPIAGGISLAGATNFDALNRPDLLPWEFFPEGTEQTRNATYHAASGRKPLYLLEGTADEYSTPSGQTQLLVDAMVAVGGEVRAAFYPGVDHLGIVEACNRLVTNPPVENDVSAWMATR